MANKKKEPCIRESSRIIGDRIKVVKKYELEAEVITHALKAMKENPSLTIPEAFEEGCREWDV